MSVVRFSISLDRDLVKKFDSYLKNKGYKNRSEAIRDFIRQAFVTAEWEENKQQVYAAITIVYDHTQREIVDRITDIQHHFHKNIISSQHIHLDTDNCLEIIAVKGKHSAIKKLYHSLEVEKKVKHVAIAKTSSGRNLI